MTNKVQTSLAVGGLIGATFTMTFLSLITAIYWGQVRLCSLPPRLRALVRLLPALAAGPLHPPSLAFLSARLRYTPPLPVLARSLARSRVSPPHHPSTHPLPPPLPLG